MAGRRDTALLSFGLPALAGAAPLVAGGITAWPAWLGVLLVAGFSGTVALRGDADPGQPVIAPDGQALYVMQRPLRTVAARGVPADAGYAVRVTTRTHAAVVLAPGGATGPEGHWIPSTGHNLALTVSAPPENPVTVRTLTASVRSTGPFPGSAGLSLISRRMPDLVLSPDLLESLQRSVAAYRPLAVPDAAILLDDRPPAVSPLGTAERPPLLVPAGQARTLVLAPVTEHPGWLRWRLTAEIEDGGRVDVVHWDLDVTAAGGMTRVLPGGATARLPVWEQFPDHWDPANGRPGTEPALGTFDVAAHPAADGTGLLTRPPRPRPDPEPVVAAELRRRAEQEHRAGHEHVAAGLWREAADAGSGPAAYALGVVLRHAGDLDQAAGWLRTAAGRRVFPAFNDLGTVELARGHAEEAEAWFRRAMDEGDWAAVVNLATVAEQRGRADEAEQLLRPAWRMHATRAADALIRLLAGQGRLDEAEELLVRDAEAAPVDGPIPSEPRYVRLFRLAEFLHNVRRDPRAAGVLRAALADPDIPPEAAARARLALTRMS
ncbi:lipopolysaccharide assembly protein LapB [Actinoplanes sp. L3-i22]|uniref:tetratricopeptide repeat protein n=1 Tax=Actinoplanes sp. L3-i22 TaxID=2836373 RepID=UPI001C75DF92|nr:tetratricopeptide repeat protein [Actinoplanes sp. L3-i22]BCY13494.1 hypothetical protein L3i22_085820 [Actinoplanes sp. L3-i22]